uniref:Uncharacterized protein n=1 Tax=Amphimedon queenslandica TaxID=400682 RepID=A0A1X7TKE4_AMPQE
MFNVRVLFFGSEGRSNSNCGNYMIDDDEECDGGRLTVDDQDSCCASNCKLRKGSNCRYLGECIDQIKDFASQLWSVIRDLNINQFALFLQENIVGCVLLISLIIWIPGVCAFHWLCDVKSLWRKCLHRSCDRTDGQMRHAFETQSSWVLQNRINQRVDLTPLLSLEEDEDCDVISSRLFEPSHFKKDIHHPQYEDQTISSISWFLVNGARNILQASFAIALCSLWWLFMSYLYLSFLSLSFHGFITDPFDCPHNGMDGYIKRYILLVASGKVIIVYTSTPCSCLKDSRSYSWAAM